MQPYSRTDRTLCRVALRGVVLAILRTQKRTAVALPVVIVTRRRRRTH